MSKKSCTHRRPRSYTEFVFLAGRQSAERRRRLCFGTRMQRYGQFLNLPNATPII